MSEQKKEYAGQEHIFKEVVVRKLGGGSRVISGEEKWDAELRGVNEGKKPWFSSKAGGLRGTVIEMQELRNRRKGREKGEDAVAEKTMEKEDIERERERRWAEHPPTPCPWPGQDDDDWNLDSPIGPARNFRKG